MSFSDVLLDLRCERVKGVSEVIDEALLCLRDDFVDDGAERLAVMSRSSKSRAILALKMKNENQYVFLFLIIAMETWNC